MYIYICISIYIYICIYIIYIYIYICIYIIYVYLLYTYIYRIYQSLKSQYILECCSLAQYDSGIMESCRWIRWTLGGRIREVNNCVVSIWRFPKIRVYPVYPPNHPIEWDFSDFPSWTIHLRVPPWRAGNPHDYLAHPENGPALVRNSSTMEHGIIPDLSTTNSGTSCAATSDSSATGTWHGPPVEVDISKTCANARVISSVIMYNL